MMSKAQSNQRGIETGASRRPSADVDSVAQSNQRGIETNDCIQYVRSCGSWLNRTSVGLKPIVFTLFTNSSGYGSIEPAWD